MYQWKNINPFMQNVHFYHISFDRSISNRMDVHVRIVFIIIIIIIIIIISTFDEKILYLMQEFIFRKLALTIHATFPLGDSLHEMPKSIF